MKDGGNLLEIANQPMLSSLSQAIAMAQAYGAWFGRPRRLDTQKFFYADPNTAPPWESLPLFSRVTVNGSGPWRLMSLQQDFIKGTAEAVLVEDN
jgi:hypothetical protein